MLHPRDVLPPILTPKWNSPNSWSCFGEIRWATNQHSRRAGPGAWVPFLCSLGLVQRLPTSPLLLVPVLDAVTGQTAPSLPPSLLPGLGCWAAPGAQRAFPLPRATSSDPLACTAGSAGLPRTRGCGLSFQRPALATPPARPPPPVPAPILATGWLRRSRPYPPEPPGHRLLRAQEPWKPSGKGQR